MRLTRAAVYAISAVYQLARDDSGACVPSHRLAATGCMPESFLRGILRRLVGAGILDSSRGPDGGYRLARAAVNISLLDLIEAVDGPLDDLRGNSRGNRDDDFPHDPEGPIALATRAVRCCLQSITAADFLAHPPTPALESLLGARAPWEAWSVAGDDWRI